eukprot:6736971-Pyramimonas_sp.AAC.1
MRVSCGISCGRYLGDGAASPRPKVSKEGAVLWECGFSTNVDGKTFFASTTDPTLRVQTGPEDREEIELEYNEAKGCWRRRVRSKSGRSSCRHSADAQSSGGGVGWGSPEKVTGFPGGEYRGEEEEWYAEAS